MFQLAPKEAGGSWRSHPRGRAGLWAPSELVRNANISTAAEIVAADEAGLGVVTKMLALFRLGQVDDRSGEHQSVQQPVRGIDVDLFIGVGVDVEARREPADDFAAAIDRISVG